MNHNDQSQRIAYMIGLWEKVNPGCEGTLSTTINNTSIGRLCETAGGPYQRVITWLEKKVDELSSSVESEPEEMLASKGLLDSEYRNALLEDKPYTDMEKADKEFQKCFELMQGRNAKYGDSWKVLSVQSIANLIEMKMHRIANMNTKDLDPKIEDEFIDAVNYGIFGLIKLK